MKKTIASSIVFGFLVLFSFQNCQKKSAADNSEAGSLVLNAILSHESLDSLTVFISDVQVITLSGNTFQAIVRKNLQIDLNNGLITESSDLSSEINNYCLPELFRIELVNMLKSFQICKTQPQLAEGTLCSMALIPPYAKLITSREHFELGSATDGCNHNKIDLCDDQSVILKSYIANLKTQYQQMSCTN